MMRTMRASAKWIMGVVAVTFVGWMVFEVGMDATARGSSAGNVVARVNGRAIDATTFYQAVRNEQERRRAEQQPVAVTLEEQQQFEDAVLEQLVQDMLLRTEFNRRGIRVSDQEIVEAARTSPPPEVLELPQFQTEGQFDLQKYQRFVASAADPTFLLALEARYREELPRIKLYEQLTAGVFVADAALWRDYRDRSDSVTIALLQLFPQVAAADTVASDAEVEAYYREHRSDFEQPAVVDLVVGEAQVEPGDARAHQNLVSLKIFRCSVVYAGGVDAYGFHAALRKDFRQLRGDAREVQLVRSARPVVAHVIQSVWPTG